MQLVPHAVIRVHQRPGDPLALASLDLLDDGAWRARVEEIQAGLRRGLEPARGLAAVRDVRVLGAIGVVQLERDVDVAAATRIAVEHGVWLRPFRDLIYTMPPYVIGEEDLARVSAAVVEVARMSG